MTKYYFMTKQHLPSPEEMAQRAFQRSGNENLRNPESVGYSVNFNQVYAWTARVEAARPITSDTLPTELIGTFSPARQEWNFEEDLVRPDERQPLASLIGQLAEIERVTRQASNEPFVDLADPVTHRVRREMHTLLGDLGQRFLNDWPVMGDGSFTNADSHTEFVATMIARKPDAMRTEVLEAMFKGENIVAEHVLTVEALNTCLYRAGEPAGRCRRFFPIARERAGQWQPDTDLITGEDWQRLQHVPGWLAKLDVTEGVSPLFAARVV